MRIFHFVRLLRLQKVQIGQLLFNPCQAVALRQPLRNLRRNPKRNQRTRCPLGRGVRRNWGEGRGSLMSDYHLFLSLSSWVFFQTNPQVLKQAAVQQQRV